MHQPFTDTSERGFETLIDTYLADVNGYERRPATHYDPDTCTDPNWLADFLDATQPTAVAKLRSLHGGDWLRKVQVRLGQEIKQRGIIDVLRKGIQLIELPKRLFVFYDQPNSTNNPDAQRLYVANRFSVMRQVRYSRQTPNKSLDIVLFVNGLPLITFELKNLLTGQTVQDAVRQYQRDRDPREELFRLGRCVVHFAVDTEQVAMCTHLTGPNALFLPFNRGYENGAGNPPNGSGIRTDYLWREVLTRDSLTNILMNFVALVEEKKEKAQPDGTFVTVKEKKLLFPRYHQLNCVRALLAHAKANGTGQRYLIQHSAGSGKSNSISWLSHQLIGLHDTQGDQSIFDALIVVTDRTVLDAQLRENIRQFDEVRLIEGITGEATDIRRLDPGSQKTGKSEHLRLALEFGKKIIICTIQTFPFVIDKLGTLPTRRFGIIIDEAHSGQSGNTSGLMNRALGQPTANVPADEEAWTGEDEIVAIIQSKKLLPNASYFAFTATPKPKTLETFGSPYPDGGKTRYRPFDLYSMKQAIEEGFILDVLKNYTPYQSYYSLLKTVADDPQFDKAKAQRKLRHFVESNRFAINKKTAVMVDHFVENVIRRGKINGLAKAMIVTSSRKNAVQYKHAFDTYLRDKNLPYQAIVAFSGDIDGETEATLNGFESSLIPDQFKQANYRFLIVAEKFQTGFDQPLLHSMYVDKKLSGVNAVQTLSRLNRTTKGKTDTFVLDFANDPAELFIAFSPFYEETKLADATDPNKLFDLQSVLDQYDVYSSDQVREFSDKLLAGKSVDELHSLLDATAVRYRTNLTTEEQDDFLGRCRGYVRLYGFLTQILPFINPYLERLYQFLSHLQHKLRRPTDDLTQGVLEAIDMESYRLQKQAETSIALQQGDYLQPMSAAVGAGAAEPEIDYLSSIVITFNERFGTAFSEEDKVRQIMANVSQDIAHDSSFLTNMTVNDPQNLRIAFDTLLSRSLLKHITTDFDVYKAYTDNPSFKAYFSERMFDMVLRSVRQA